jgi:hypothetical protein
MTAATTDREARLRRALRRLDYDLKVPSAAGP